MIDEEAAILGQAETGIVAADDKGRIVFANLAAAEAMGRSLGVGSMLSDLMPERLREKHHSGFRRYVETGESRLEGRTVRVPALAASGDEREVDLTIRVFRRPDGSKLAVASVQAAATGRPPRDLYRIESALAARAYRLI